MLFNASVAPDVNNGFTRFVRNIAAMYNRGFEFSINANVFRAKDWDINLGFTGTTLENKITKLNDPVVVEFGGLFNVPQLRPGFPISGLYGDSATVAPVFPAKVAVAAADRAFIGTSIPKFEGSVNASVSYKNVTLLALFGGKSGYYRFNTTDRDLADPSVRMHKDYWNLSPKEAFENFNYLPNWIQKADFVKLRQLSVSYKHTPTNRTNFIKDMTISVVGSNLYTWSQYKGGYDIEAETSGSSSGNAWVRGMDAWEAGPPRQWTVSFNIGF